MGWLSSIGSGVAQTGSLLSTKLMGLGEGVAGAMDQGTAGGASKAATLYGTAGTGLAAGGDLLSGLGAAQAANFQSQVSHNNATILRQSASDAIAAGGAAEGAHRIATGRLVAAQKAAQAANGVDTGVGSAVEVRDSTQAEGDLDTAVIHYNALREAFGLNSQAANAEAQSKIEKSAAGLALVGGGIKAGSTLLSGASALNAKWAAYKQSGIKVGGS